MISYTITVAVSVAAGADAIVSAAPALGKQAWVPVAMSIAFVVVLAFGNLRGIREAGRVFAIPTYFFIFNMAVLIVLGLCREASGDLPHQPAHPGTLPLGHASGGLILGVSAFFLLRAFANGSSAMTGHRGHLQRRQHLPEAAGPQRPDDPGAHEHDPRGDVPRGVGAGRAHPQRAVRVGHADGGLGDRHARLRLVPRRARRCSTRCRPRRH